MSDEGNSIFASEKLAIWWRQTLSGCYSKSPFRASLFPIGTCPVCCSLCRDFLPLSCPGLHVLVLAHASPISVHFPWRPFLTPAPGCLPPSSNSRLDHTDTPSSPHLLPADPSSALRALGWIWQLGSKCLGLAQSSFQARLCLLATLSLCPAQCWPIVGF